MVTSAAVALIEQPARIARAKTHLPQYLMAAPFQSRTLGTIISTFMSTLRVFIS